MGRMVAVSIAQGGSGLPCLSCSTYSYLRGEDVSAIPPNTSEVPDSNVMELITKVRINVVTVEPR